MVKNCHLKGINMVGLHLKYQRNMFGVPQDNKIDALLLSLYVKDWEKAIDLIQVQKYKSLCVL